MDVFCIGMPRSASTWQYGVACALIERHRGGKRMGYFHTADLTAGCPAPAPGRDGRGGWRVFKSHAPPSDWLAARLAAGEAKAIYSYRDVRDVAFSLAHLLSGSFEQIVEKQRSLDLAIAADDFWQGRDGVASQRYERIMADPEAAIAEIARHLGIELAPGEAAELAREQSLAANKARADKMAREFRGEAPDPDAPVLVQSPTEGSLLTWNHIREGKVGGWRAEASPRQLAVLAVACGPWLIRRGYEPDNAWAEPARSFLAGASGSGQGAAAEGQVEVVPWEVQYAQMSIQGVFYRHRYLMEQASREGTDPGTLATLEAEHEALLKGLQDAMKEKAAEVETFQKAAAHFQTCYEASRQEADFFRGQSEAKGREADLLRDQLGAARGEADFLGKQLEAREKELAFVRDQLEAKGGEVDFLRGQHLATRAEADFLRDQLDAKGDELTFVRGQLGARDDEVRFLRRQLDARDEEVRFLRGQLATREEEAAFTRSQLAPRDEEIRFLRGQVDARSDESAFLRDQLDARGKEVTFLRDQLDAKGDELTFVRGQLDARDEEVRFLRDSFPPDDAATTASEALAGAR